MNHRPPPDSRRPTRRPTHRSRTAPFLAGLVLCLSVARSPLLADPAVLPGTGLELRIEGAGSAGGAPGSGPVTIVSNVFLHVGPAETPDPFVPPGPFRARWSGLLSVDLRGDFQFRAEARGRLELEINGTRVLPAEDPAPEGGWSAPVRLRKGTNAILATLENRPPSGGPDATHAGVRLWWRGRGVTPQPIPATALTPPSPLDEAALAASESVRAGRDLFLGLRCGRCHAPDVAQPVPELGMDAPAFDSLGSRLRRAWIARWITDPRPVQPASVMPRMVHGTQAGAEAAAMAAWLASLKSPAPASPPPATGNAAAGRALFATLRCSTCHTAPDEAPTATKVSLASAGDKFLPPALPEFLRAPARHYAWTPMPDFQLSAEEAANLAAWLLATPPGAAPAAGTTPVAEDSADPAMLRRGRELVETSGCLACHAGPAENRFRARPLKSLPAEGWDRGCMADTPPASGNVPWFALETGPRADLRAFARSDRASLGRHVPADFADRWSRRLRCNDCHGALENGPGLLHAGEKLRPEWTRRLLEGAIAYKPRPWLPARMPAFPAFAPFLAPGIAARHGVPPGSPPEPPLDPAAAADGRRLVSASGGFACVTCHPIGGFSATAVFEAPGINLARVAERLRPEYFDRWVRHPQSIDPTTKMPLYFDEEGNSALTDFYGGDGPRTVQALWNYVRQGTNAPPPEP